MKKLKFLTLLFLGINSLSCFGYTDAEIAKALADEVKRQSVSLPLETREVKIFSMVAGPGKVVTYRTIIKGVVAKNLPIDWKIKRRALLIKQYCTDPGLKPFWRDDIAVAWTDLDASGTWILNTGVSLSDCKK